jgi:hypothetical protein
LVDDGRWRGCFFHETGEVNFERHLEPETACDPPQGGDRFPPRKKDVNAAVEYAGLEAMMNDNTFDLVAVVFEWRQRPLARR